MRSLRISWLAPLFLKRYRCCRFLADGAVQISYPGPADVGTEGAEGGTGEAAATDALRQTIRGLVEHATAPEHVYRHTWSRSNELLIFDNRRLLHRALPYDERHTRLVWHISTKGERPAPYGEEVAQKTLLTPADAVPLASHAARL